MRYVESPHEYHDDLPVLFLAGGITRCPDWQSTAVQLLTGVPDIVVANPRRREYPMDDPDAAAQQVAWEHHYLHRATVIVFWFAAAPSDQPIVWYELGVHAARQVPLAVGADPDYHRRQDVLLQVGLARPGLTVHSRLADTVAAARGLLPGSTNPGVTPTRSSGVSRSG